MAIERVKTGVYGLDELIQGGFPKGRTVLVSGACGTGKSIFAMQFLYRGATEYAEPGVFVTFDEMPEKIRQDMLAFGWNLKDLEDKGLLAIVDGTSGRAGTPSEEEHVLMPGQMDLDRILVEIMSVARNLNAKRIVIDSIPALAYHLEDSHEIRKAILKLAYVINRSGITAVITSEIPEQGLGGNSPIKFSKYDVEEYVSDGVILLNFLGLGPEAGRTMYLRKMRGTKQAMEVHPFTLGDKGIEVRKIEEVLRM